MIIVSTRGAIAMLAAAIACLPLAAATFTVTSTADSGSGSLRHAMLDANSNAGPDAIHFAIGTGLQTIQPLSPLPAITETVTIDATTQPGFAGKPLVELSGATSGGDGLYVLAGDSTTIRGFIINRCYVGIILNTNGNIVAGNFVGTDANGTAPSSYNGILVRGSANRIGGTSASDRNVIAGNSHTQIAIDVGASNNLVEGNYIGTDYTGTAALPCYYGVVIAGTANTIGGNATGARNVISGCFNNVTVAGDDNTIAGNFIGTDANGTAVLVPEYGVGIEITTGSNNTIGGTTAAARNVLSGNSVGVDIANIFTGPNGTVVTGNFIGTDVSGSIALGNTYGVIVGPTATGTVIGGTDPGAGNVISGSSSDALQVNGAVVVQGNLIGTNADGTAALTNRGTGIAVDGAGAIIGGSVAGARNVVSANGWVGIDLRLSTGGVVQGNYIGTAIDGTTPVGNAYAGIRLLHATNNTIGGIKPGEGNVIANNAIVGVILYGGFQVFSGYATGNAIRGNSIFANRDLGITINDDGSITGTVHPNDLKDIDGGSNLNQNFPVLTGAVIAAGSTTVTGTLNSTPLTVFEVDYYDNPSCDPSGYGEGKTYLGTSTVTTDAEGNAALSSTFPGATNVVTATATDPAGNTSEFSACATAVAPVLSIGDASAMGGSDVVFTVTLSVSVPTLVTVEFVTADGTAVAGTDYTSMSGTLTFAPGVLTQQIVVPTTAIPSAIPRTFVVNLSNAAIAAIADGQATGMIIEPVPAPALSEWALLLLAGMLALFGAIAMKR